MDLLQFIGLVVVILFALRLAVRFFLPILLAWWVRRMQNRAGFGGFYNDKQQERTSEKEGSIHIDYEPEEKSAKEKFEKGKGGKGGEYVDFEDLKE